MASLGVSEAMQLHSHFSRLLICFWSLPKAENLSPNVTSRSGFRTPLLQCWSSGRADHPFHSHTSSPRPLTAVPTVPSAAETTPWRRGPWDQLLAPGCTPAVMQERDFSFCPQINT